MTASIKKKQLKKKKIKILRLVTSLDPKYGGPRNGILSSNHQLIKNGFKVDVATCDKKGITNKEYKNTRIINFKSYIGKNYRFSLKLLLWIYKKRKEYDFFIIHGIWQFNSLAARLLLTNKKYFVFTHGQLDPYFSLNFYRMLKKNFYWYLIEKKNLINSGGIILTSKGELNNLKKTYVNTNKIKKIVIKYGILKSKLNNRKCKNIFRSQFPLLNNQRFYLFLGRYDQKKGCEIIINSIIKIRKNFKSKILFAGPTGDARYLKSLKGLVEKNNLKNIILFSDAIYEDLKWGAILSSRASILPSHGENFGISVAESLSQSKPVLISNKVNIFKTIDKYKAGLVSSNTTLSFSKKLLQFEKLGIKELDKMSNNASKCFKDNFDISSNNNSLSNFLIKEFNKKNANSKSKINHFNNNNI